MSDMWARRREPLSGAGWWGSQRICPTCWHTYTTGNYRGHLRGWMHKERRGWWLA